VARDAAVRRRSRGFSYSNRCADRDRPPGSVQPGSLNVDDGRREPGDPRGRRPHRCLRRGCGGVPAGLGQGAGEDVKELLGGRRLLQEIVEPELQIGVERATGRAIRATLSATHVDPDVSAEIFLFERGAAQ
jgi:hypothetical protein